LARSLLLPAALAGAGAILGHVFNPIFRFRGGKGVSTTIGIALGLIPKSFLISLIVWIIVYIATYLVSLASIVFAAILPLITVILQDGKPLDRVFILVLALLVIYAHRTNIMRLLNKEEPKTIFWKKR
jgi:glycerol-3-phosphate acyltransferase PlsY